MMKIKGSYKVGFIALVVSAYGLVGIGFITPDKMQQPPDFFAASCLGAVCVGAFMWTLACALNANGD